jgi:hypothetical protein
MGRNNFHFGETAMGMELIGDQGRYVFTIFGWKMAIDLGREYGWKPAGALPLEYESDEEWDDDEFDGDEWDDESDDEWDERAVAPKEFDAAEARGSALSVQFFDELRSSDQLTWSNLLNDRAAVTDADARALGAALGRALPDVPRRDAQDHWDLADISSPEFLVFSKDARVSPLEWFSGPNRESLRTFVAFCRRGGFEISREERPVANQGRRDLPTEETRS